MRGPKYSGVVLGGRYLVGDLLGEGGWGSVYAATQNDLGRKVAIKILHTEVAIAGEGVARFAREARAAAALGHPNIAQVTDFQSNPDEPPFLVMELLAGETLGALLRREPRLAPNRVAAISYQILSALDVAHKAGIVHRDVKPDNVFLVKVPGIDDFVKLLDFGIAKLSSEGAAQITDASTMLGSPAFMAPEQVTNAGIDHRADLYAVGATMYLALAGRLPLDATAVHRLLLAIMEEKPTPLTSLDSRIDPRLSAVVERALAKDPAARFASAAEMRVAIEPWAMATARPGMTPVQLESPFTGPSLTPGGPPSTLGSAGNAPAPIGPIGPPTPGFYGPGAGTPGYGAPGSASPMSMTSTPHVGAMPPFGATPPPMSPLVGPPLGTPPPGVHAPVGMGGSAMHSPSGTPSPSGPHAYAPPMGSPLSGQGAPSAPVQASSAGAPSGGSWIVIGLLVAIVGLLVVIGGAGIVGFLYYRSSAGEPPAPIPPIVPATPSAATATASTVASASPTSAPSNATAAATTTSTAKKPSGPTPPGPTPPGPTPVADAGPPPTPVVDAGPPHGPKQMGGTNPRITGGVFGKYDIEQSRAAINVHLSAITACYVATEFEPPDHQFTYYTFTIDPSGVVKDVRRSTPNGTHPKLDNCMLPILRRVKWQAIPGGGEAQVGFGARTRDNP